MLKQKTYKSKKGERVSPERWQWIAEYKNGEKICQFDDKKEYFTSIRELDITKIVKFGMINTETGQRFILDIEPEETQVFHYYLNFGELRQKKYNHQSRIYVFGFKHRGSINAVYNFILPDDTLVIKNNQNL